MKGIIFTVIIWVFFANTAISQSIELSVLELNGSVKYLKETSKLNNSSEVLIQEIEYFFNRKGNVLNKNDLFNEKIYQYNYGNKDELIKTSIYNLENELLFYGHFEYNEDDKMIRYSNINNKDELVYEVKFEYLNHNVEKIESKFDSNNDLVSKCKEILDSEGKIISRLEYGSDNAIKKEFRYKYNSNGKVIEYSKFNSLGEIEWKVEKLYNKKNHLLKNVLTSYVSTKNHIWDFDYEFDLNDNWTQKSIVENGESKKIYERKIEYY